MTQQPPWLVTLNIYFEPLCFRISLSQPLVCISKYSYSNLNFFHLISTTFICVKTLLLVTVLPKYVAKDYYGVSVVSWTNKLILWYVSEPLGLYNLGASRLLPFSSMIFLNHFITPLTYLKFFFTVFLYWISLLTFDYYHRTFIRVSVYYPLSTCVWPRAIRQQHWFHWYSANLLIEPPKLSYWTNAGYTRPIAAGVSPSYCGTSIHIFLMQALLITFYNPNLLQTKK